MNKKIVKLTESDLNRLVKKIIEEDNAEIAKKIVTRKELIKINIDKLRKKIKEMQDKLDTYERQLKTIK
jgi:DNA-binding transcriptional MerR regulator